MFCSVFRPNNVIMSTTYCAHIGLSLVGPTPVVHFILCICISSWPTYFAIGALRFTSTGVRVSALPLVQCDAPYMSSVTDKLEDMKLQNERIEAQVDKMAAILRGLPTGESLTYVAFVTIQSIRPRLQQRLT